MTPALSRHSKGDENPTSPRRTSNEAKETAAMMLFPVLSRAREQQREELEQQKEDLGLSGPSEDPMPDSAFTDDIMPIGDTTSSSTKRNSSTVSRPFSPALTFKATAQAIQAMTHPVHMPRFKGGEGIRRLVETREKNTSIIGMSVEYWDISLFSLKGRAWPMLPQLIYIFYSTAMVAIVCTKVNDYQNVKEFAALQFPISTLGLALFLLLSFRTNSSYERWWEGRKCWDGIIIHIQDSARMALGWVAPKSTDVASNIIRWLICYVFVAKKSVRIENEYPELAGILSEAEIQQLQTDLDPVELTQNRLTEFNAQAAELGVPIPIYASLDSNLKQLFSNLTAAMRILSTPMPFAYIVHLRSFMVLWLAGLPFAFVSTLGWWSILVCSVVGYELLGFETIGVEIENPFGRDYNDLPLDMITTELFVRLAGMLGKLGHIVDVDPILHLDPLNNADYVAKQHHHVVDALNRSGAKRDAEGSAAVAVSHHANGDGDG